LENFLNELAANDRSICSRVNYAVAVRTLETFNKPYKELTKEDMVKWVAQIKAHYAESTVATFKVLVKRFIKWTHYGSDKNKKDYPQSVAWIETESRKKLADRIQRKTIISHEDLMRLLNSVKTLRDRALLFCLYESACRAGEILSLKINDIELNQQYAVIAVEGKTGRRRIPLVISVPDLKQWLDKHPQKDNPDAPLWQKDKKGKGDGLGYDGLRTIIRRAAKRVGLKEIHPHLFRHTRITHLTSIFKDAEMKEYVGWAKDSDMAAIYYHNTSEDTANTLFKHYGIKPENGKTEDPLVTKKCPACDFDNSAVAKFCMRCSSAFDAQTAFRFDKLKMKEGEISTKVIEAFAERAPEILKRILDETGLGQQITTLGQRITEFQTAKATESI
jgi:integrase